MLVEESVGHPVRYTRSAYAATGNCILMALSNREMQALRKESETIDRAVTATAREGELRYVAEASHASVKLLLAEAVH